MGRHGNQGLLVSRRSLNNRFGRISVPNQALHLAGRKIFRNSFQIIAESSGRVVDQGADHRRLIGG